MEDRAVRLLQGRAPVCGNPYLALLHCGSHCSTLRRGLRDVGPAVLYRLQPGRGIALATARTEEAQWHHDEGRK